ncbi:MAG: inositol monophosphatase family protein [Pirellulaceae bacterium]|nr:inositol monophosphatase family protein [Pirellulaceae bacterium]HJN13082.1 inositol monophosphatase family protein [Pirellulaceae bacterium]
MGERSEQVDCPRLRELWEATTMTQQELAEKADCGESKVQQLLNGRSDQALPRIVSGLAKALEVDREELLARQGSSQEGATSDAENKRPAPAWLAQEFTVAMAAMRRVQGDLDELCDLLRRPQDANDCGDLAKDVFNNVERGLRSELEEHSRFKTVSPQSGCDWFDEQDDFYWAIDPIDGKRHIRHGLFLFTSTLALVEKIERQRMRRDKSVLGLTYIPFSRELFYAQRSYAGRKGGTRVIIDGKEHPDPLRVEADPNEKIVYAEFPNRKLGARLPEACAKLELMFSEVQRAYGIAVGSWGLTLVARGTFHAYVDLSNTTRFHNMVAGRLLVEEAGGAEELIGDLDPVCYVVGNTADTVKALREILTPRTVRPS